MDINTKTIKLIHYLLDGYSIVIDGETYALKDNYELCVRRVAYNDGIGGGTQSHVWLKILGDPTIRFYRKLAEKVTEEELFLIGANKVLTDIGRKR